MKIIVIILAALLVLSAGGLAGRYIYLAFFAPAHSTATVPDNLIGEEAASSPDGDGTASSVPTMNDGRGSEQPSDIKTGGTPVSSRPAADKPAAPKLELYEGKPEGSGRFEVQNMFPGDVETTYFLRQGISRYRYRPLFSGRTLQNKQKNLGKMLHIKVTHMETGRVLCDAPFAEIDGMELSEPLKESAADETTAYYRIDVSLDTSAGNGYQAALLKADFAWYVKDEGGLTPPPTGSTTNRILWVILAASSFYAAPAVGVLGAGRRRGMNKQKQIRKKLTASVVTMVILAFGLCITTFALVYSIVTVDNNRFQTGTVKINLNGGKPVIEDHEFLFEPGMTVEKGFFIENESTWDVYYRLYLENVEGGLAEVLDVSIRDGDTVLYSGKAADLTETKAVTADDRLKLHERRELTITFHYPEEAGNSAQTRYLSFNLSADAVQTKNNPRRQFD